MSEHVIDFSNAHSIEDAHDVLAASLDLPPYYGRNLDALWDCLTELRGPVHIRVRGRRALLAADHSRGTALCSLFDEITSAGGGVTVEWVDPN
ncbi:barstar family protein [Tahibacter sp.]|uniref:barstar family protein n=1 Tax=Tahibacter sp. TaxID=2056211 RepID=UPI0039C8F1E9